MAEDKTAAGPVTETPSSNRRQAWRVTWLRVAWVTGAFAVLLGGLLLFNGIRLYRGAGAGKVRLVEAQELIPLKNELRKDPRNAALKEEIRLLDQRLREEYFRRERMNATGGWLLVGAVIVCLSALQAALTLKPAASPVIPRQAPDPAGDTIRSGKAVAAAGLALAGLTTALVWGTGPVWQQAEEVAGGSGQSPSAGSGGAVAPAVGDAGWFAPQEEFDRQWPRFRGPGGMGVVKMDGLPESWDGPSGKNVLWKTAVPLPGENSPVIWGDRVFLTGATEKLREVYCFDAATGALLWKQPVATPQGSRGAPPKVLEDTGFAAPTAVVDGRRVVAMFANGEIGAFDFSGKPLWTRALGTPENTYGHATSLAIWQNRVIVVFDQGQAEDKLSKILALDTASGETVWSTSRPVPNSWVTPVVATMAGKPQIITSADPWVIAYEPATGKEIWRAECMQGDVAPSPAYSADTVFVANEGACLAAIKADGSGDVTQSKILWKWDDGSLPDMCSLLCDGPRVYMITYGMMQAFDVAAGKQLWEHDFESEFHASPSLVNGRIWVLTRKGVTVMGEATQEGFKETGRSALGEDCNASHVFVGGRLFLRGKKNLYCIGTKDGK